MGFQIADPIARPVDVRQFGTVGIPAEVFCTVWFLPTVTSNHELLTPDAYAWT
jgi:hypothetical protein